MKLHLGADGPSLPISLCAFETGHHSADHTPRQILATQDRAFNSRPRAIRLHRWQVTAVGEPQIPRARLPAPLDSPAPPGREFRPPDHIDR